MTRAYNEDYVFGAMERLGCMMDYAENAIGLDAAVFWRYFISSGVADLFGSGHPRYRAGMSGSELARLVVTTVSDLELSDNNDVIIYPGDAYWAGWALAYFQWYTGLSFRYIDTHGMDIETVLRLYHPLHEADVTKFVETGLTRIRHWYEDHPSPLKTLRKNARLTQKDLSLASGVSLRMIRAYEQGAQDISKAEVAAVLSLADVLKVSPRELIP